VSTKALSIEDDIAAAKQRTADLEKRIAGFEAKAVEAEMNYRPSASADGGAGRDARPFQRDPAQAFNDLIREDKPEGGSAWRR
jgi:hypothetical protein